MTRYTFEPTHRPGNSDAAIERMRKRLLEQQAGVPVQRVDLVDPHQRAPLFIASKPVGAK
jgi:hypothetical protein